MTAGGGRAYYNEIEPYAAQWLRNLIDAGHLAPGEVDTRSIVDVRPSDLGGFDQCHFFAGIGGWAYAARLAGWPDERPLWTGSCPCQPFSVAGKQLGTDDPRHLWPHFFRLIRACRPPVVMGEQVAGAAGYGWLDGVRFDLAGEGYASRGVDIPACSVDAPHLRSRLYWLATNVGDAHHAGLEVGGGGPEWLADQEGRQAAQRLAGLSGVSGDVADAYRAAGQQDARGASRHEAADGRARRNWGQSDGHHGPSGHGEGAGRNGTFWSDHVWLTGADGKSRRAKPGLPLLAHGVPARVGRLRAYGNAIVPQLAAEIIAAFMEAQP